MPDFHKKPERKIFYNVTELPTYLYQYKSLEGERMSWAKEFITTKEFYFSSAEEFNDPLDCKIEPIFDTSIEIKKAYWKNVINREFPNLKKDSNRAIKKFLRKIKRVGGVIKLSNNFLRA
nr:hypothetical protein [Desulfobacula sp.]